MVTTSCPPTSTTAHPSAADLTRLSPAPAAPRKAHMAHHPRPVCPSPVKEDLTAHLASSAAASSRERAITDSTSSSPSASTPEPPPWTDPGALAGWEALRRFSCTHNFECCLGCACKMLVLSKNLSLCRYLTT